MAETSVNVEEPQQPPIPRKVRQEGASSPPIKQEEGASSIKLKQEDSPTTNGAAPPVSDPLPPIPRNVAPPPSDPRTAVSSTETPARRGIPGPTVGLPEGVTVPPTVDTNLLQGRLLETLKQLPVDLINDALVEYSDALQNKGDSIRNKGAYLFGVLKRYANVQERAASGQAEGVMGQTLTPAVQERLEKLVTDGFCTQEEMNDKVKSKIRMLSEKDALFAIDELSSVEREQIRNFSSYFMGILNRYMRGDKAPGPPRPDDRKKPRHAPDMYGRNVRKYDDRSRGRSPDRDYRRRDDDRRYGDQEYRSSRERSRDRHDDDRGRSRRSDSRTRFDDSFRSQSQPPPPQQQLPPPQQYQQGQFGGYVPPQPHFRQGMQPMSAYAPQQQQQQPPQQQHMYVQPNQAFQQQQPRPQHYVPQQGTGPLGIPGSSFVPQQTMGLQQPPQMGQSYVATLQQQQQQQPPLMGNQLQQSLAAANVSSYGAPAPGTWQSQSMPSTQTIPADILALADKASSAVQFLQASRSLSQPVVNNLPQMQIPTQLNSFSYSNPVPSSQPPPNRRGRTTATMNELPVTVQYAVQNLQATGHVDGTLDEGILGMIKDLPETMALQALQKFSSIDTNQMRNRTAYLAGVLRRELEMIQRR